MITRKMMALAAIPVAALLTGGGVAVAQAAGTPPATAVVEQAVVQHSGDPCHWHQATPAKMAARHDGHHGNHGRDHADHGQTARAGSRATVRAQCAGDRGHE